MWVVWSGGANDAIAKVGGVAALHRSHRLELDRPGEVFEAVEEPASGAEQDGHDVHLDLVEFAGPDAPVLGGVMSMVGFVSLPGRSSGRCESPRRANSRCVPSGPQRRGMWGSVLGLKRLEGGQRESSSSLSRTSRSDGVVFTYQSIVRGIPSSNDVVGSHEVSACIRVLSEARLRTPTGRSNW